MEWLTNIPDWLSLLFGGSLISLVTWRFARQKAAAEAKEAEAKAKQAEAEAEKAKAEALMEKQNYYQQMADDLAKDRDYYKKDRDETREKFDKMSRNVMEWKRDTDNTIEDLRRKVARNGRQIDMMRPFMCGDMKCKKLLMSVLHDTLEPIRQRRAEYEKDIPAVYDILKKGCEVARETAAATMDEVRRAMKINYFDDNALIEEQSKRYGK